MPKPCPQEFRENIVRVARNREPGVTLEQVAADEMMHPLVRELAAADAPARVPVAVTCRVLGLARRPYYR